MKQRMHGWKAGSRLWSLAIVVAGLSGLNVKLFAADAPPPPPPPAWHGDIAFGLSLARGNSDTLLLNASASARKEWKHGLLKLGVDGAYGVNNWGQKNETSSADSLHGFVDYKHLFSERAFAGVRCDAYYDWIAHVHYRFILGPAAGYYFIKSPATRLSADIGPSILYERVGSNSDEGYMTLRLGERFEHDFGKGAKVWQ